MADLACNHGATKLPRRVVNSSDSAFPDNAATMLLPRAISLPADLRPQVTSDATLASLTIY